MSSALDILKLNRSSAVAEEAVFAHWQDYRRWLRLRLELLDVRRAEVETTIVFDDSDEQDSRARAMMIEASLKSISSESRLVFERVFSMRLNELRTEAELQATGTTRHLDLDFEGELERQALSRLLAECEGEGREDGMGLVPVAPESENGWYAVELSALDALPADASYEIQARPGWRAYRLQIIAFAALLIGVIIFNLLPYLPTADSLAGDLIAGAASYNELPLTASFPAEVTLTMHNGEQVTLQVEPRAAAWFPPELAADAAGDRLYWQDAGLSYPARLCLPAGLVSSDISSLMVHDGRDLPARSYRPADPQATTFDLSIQPCNGGEALTMLLDSVEPLAVELPELPVAADAATSLTLLGVDVVSADREAAIPLDSVRLDVRVAVLGEHPDWPALQPRLLLSSGAEYALIGTPRLEGDTVVLSYSMPAPQYARDALWLLSPDPQHVLRWRLHIAPPPSRAALLAQELSVGEPTARVHAGTMQIRLPLRNQGDLPLLLQAADLQISYPDLPADQAPPALIDGLAEPLQAGEERSIRVTAPLSQAAALSLTIGDTVFDLALAPEGGDVTPNNE